MAIRIHYAMHTPSLLIKLQQYTHLLALLTPAALVLAILYTLAEQEDEGESVCDMSSLRNVLWNRTPRPKGKEPGRNHLNHILLHLKGPYLTLYYTAHQRGPRKKKFIFKSRGN